MRRLKTRTLKRAPRRGDSLEPFLRDVDRRLGSDGDNPHGNQHDPLDELVFIILSAQTESYLYRETFEALKAAYTPWDRLLTASENQIARIIRRGGLANKKARQLKAAFEQIVSEQGVLCLRFLADHSDEDVLDYLMSLPGIGVKSAKCIMMYSLRRAVFPVDTHVWRISRRLGFAPHVPKPSDAQEKALEGSVPEDLRHGLHVKFVTLGRETCRTYFPKCDACALSAICPSRGRPDRVWAAWRQPSGVWSKANPDSQSARQSLG